MILDTSAVIAVIREEDGFRRLGAALERAESVAIGAPTLFETNLVALRRWGEDGHDTVMSFRDDWELEVVPFDQRHVRAAAEAFSRYGKGRHPAALNYGDCMTYASARLAELPLLFTGNDFFRTDVESAL